MNQIHYRLNAEEAAIIEKKAAEVGLKPNTYAKKIALEGKVKAPLIDLQAARLILPQISKVGANVNQIARSLNMGASVAPEAVEDIKTQLRELMADIWAAILDGKKPKKKEEAAAMDPVEPDQKNDDTQCSEEEHNETQENSDTPCNETEHTESQESHICPGCGAPLERTLSAKGRYYWRCTENGNKCPFGGWAD